MRRQTSFTSPVDLAVDREIDSKYDVIAKVSEQIDAIEAINAAIEDGTLDDAIAITGMQVSTGDEGSDTTWDGTTLTVPRGDTGARGAKGDDGLNGVTPNYEFTYDPATGLLGYELISYVDINTGTEIPLPLYLGVEEIVDIIETEEEW